MCDQVSDGILDALIKDDKGSRVACETLTKTGFVMVAGEVTSTAQIDIPKIVRGVVKEIGYSDSDMGFDWQTCGVMVALEQQSPDIAQGVDGKGVYTRDEQGAGDQGMMFGYACDETPELMPLPIHDRAQAGEEARRRAQEGHARLPPPRRQEPGLGSLRQRRSSARHRRGRRLHPAQRDVKYKTLKEAVMEEVVRPVLPARLVSNKTKFFINPTGRFVVGGPMGDSGLTGRKIIVDTYGGMGRHGGGAFSGKDPSKVDRSACYYARYIAKNVVAAGLARRCEVQVAYAIGVAEPVSLLVHTFGTATDLRGSPGRDRARQLRLPPRRAHPRAEPAAPHLPEDRRLRSLRPHRTPTSSGRGPTRPTRSSRRPASSSRPTATSTAAPAARPVAPSAAPLLRSRSERSPHPRPAQCGAAGIWPAQCGAAGMKRGSGGAGAAGRLQQLVPAGAGAAGCL